MRLEERGYGWLGAYVLGDFDIYSADADRVILAVVEPVITECRRRRWIRGFFFMRYIDERGSHIRFRFLCRPRLRRERVEPLIRETVSAAQARGLPISDIAWAAYHPEVERYGGPHGVVLAERHFEDSSNVALELLGADRSVDRRGLLGKALLAQLVLLHTFLETRGSVARMAQHYGSSYLQQVMPDPTSQQRRSHAFEQGFQRQANHLSAHVEAAWEALVDQASLTPVMDRYRGRLQELRRRLRSLATAGRLLPHDSWAQSVVALVPSYLHMMNNRLGVRIQDECYLSVLIRSALTTGPDRVSA